VPKASKSNIVSSPLLVKYDSDVESTNVDSVFSSDSTTGIAFAESFSFFDSSFAFIAVSLVSSLKASAFKLPSDLNLDGGSSFSFSSKGSLASFQALTFAFISSLPKF